MKPGGTLLLLLALLALTTTGIDAWAGPRTAPVRVAAENGGGGNININIIVRQVSITPAVAPVGETIQVSARSAPNCRRLGSRSTRASSSGR